MHIMTDLQEAKTFVKNMDRSLGDAGHWADWHILEIATEPPLDWIKQAKVTALLRAQLPDDDGSILWLDRVLIAVFKATDRLNLDSLTGAVRKNLATEEVRIDFLSVVQDADKVKDALTRAQGRDDVPDPPPASYSFLKTLVPNVEELLAGWHKEKKNREGREKPHVMVVDDDQMTLRMVCGALARDYNVIPARNGAEAIAKHLQMMPDIIFLDIGLPDCDGLTLLDYMQQYDPDCRIVMFSADDFLKTRVRAFVGGAKGFLGKPFNLRAFQRQIAEWFSGKEGGA